MGLYLWRASLEGCRGYYQFMYSSVGADPYYALDAREDDLVAAALRSDGSLVPHDRLVQHSEAIDDMR